jgi:type IV fimbrial biogenesis protein FimT
MKRNSRGFNLLELMIAITVVGILLGLSVPTYRQFTRSNTATAAQNDLVTSFNYARSEALRRNRSVSVCSSTDGATCGDDTAWTSGWIAFSDRGTAGLVDGTDEVLQVWRRTDSILTINSTGGSFVQFQRTGMAAAGMTVNIRWTGCTGNNVRRTAVLPTGALFASKVSC